MKSEFFMCNVGNFINCKYIKKPIPPLASFPERIDNSDTTVFYFLYLPFFFIPYPLQDPKEDMFNRREMEAYQKKHFLVIPHYLMMRSFKCYASRFKHKLLEVEILVSTKLIKLQLVPTIRSSYLSAYFSQ